LGRGLIVTTTIAAGVAAIVTLADVVQAAVISHHGLLSPSFPSAFLSVGGFTVLS